MQQNVVIPEGIHCCGFAGDKGFTTPELNAHSLRTLKDAVQYCSEGISTSRTCEIGLTHGGIDYHGLVYLVDRVTQARPAEGNGLKGPQPLFHATAICDRVCARQTEFLLA
jgi:D-lactate dehydrogenase